jgi:dTDP-4-dehydrorhamnose reductase
VEVEIEPIETGEAQRRAHRPPYSALTTVRAEEVGVSPLRSWKEALGAYLQAKGLG